MRNRQSKSISTIGTILSNKPTAIVTCDRINMSIFLLSFGSEMNLFVRSCVPVYIYVYNVQGIYIYIYIHIQVYIYSENNFVYIPVFPLGTRASSSTSTGVLRTSIILLILPLVPVVLVPGTRTCTRYVTYFTFCWKYFKNSLSYVQEPVQVRVLEYQYILLYVEICQYYQPSKN
jgi:hypothetical protein